MYLFRAHAFVPSDLPGASGLPAAVNTWRTRQNSARTPTSSLAIVALSCPGLIALHALALPSSLSPPQPAAPTSRRVVDIRQPSRRSNNAWIRGPDARSVT
ncbi:hypothetical protein DPSP01_009667 [Paraphaeosphaeria sporulosa]